MNRILVTGGAGFIGCNIVDYLLSHNENVLVIDNLSRKGTEINRDWLKRKYEDKFQFIQGDICDYDMLKKAMEGIEVVYHMAAQVAVTTSVVKPRTDFCWNALGTFNVLEAAREVGNDPIVLFASTNKVYGKMENVEIVEELKHYKYRNFLHGIPESRNLDFYSPYGCSKGAADQYVLDYFRIYELRTVVFRQSCIYGQHQFGNEDQGWVAHFLISALFDRPFTIYGNGKQVRDILHIDDLINCFQKAIENIDKAAGKVYNIGGGPTNALSLLKLIEILKKKFGKNIKFSFSDWRPGDQPIYISDIRKSSKELGWEPKISFREGLERLYHWVEKNRETVCLKLVAELTKEGQTF